MYRPKSLKIKNILSWKEVEFQFHQGKAVIIVGENKDDPGQKGNGSGKSGLTEGAVIAIAGTCIRPIKNKEIVRRGCDEGEIELVLENAMLNTELRIWRKLYSGSKSAEYKMWENGEDCNERYSDFNSFNAFVWTMLGISKEDFFSFYVLEKTETPFLLMGDTEKKKVVNRFSGANKVDGALPFVEKDVAEKQKVVTLIDNQILGIRGKQELLSEQIETEEKKYSEEGKQEQLQEIERQLTVLQNNLELKKTQKTDFDKQLEDKKKELAKCKKTDFTKKNQELQQELSKESTKQKGIENKIVEINERKTQGMEIEVELKNSLAGLIECPKCQYEFVLEAEEGFDVQVNKTDLKELQEDILPSIERELITAREELSKQKMLVQAVQVKIRSLQTEEQIENQARRTINLAIQSLETKLFQVERDVTKITLDTEMLDKQIDQINEGQSEKLDEMNEQLLQYVDQETELRERLQEAEDERIACEQWLTYFKSFKSHLANKSIANIQDYTNLYLQKMGSNIQIEIEGYKTLSNKKLKEEITVMVVRNGIDRASYGAFSGGERGRIDICVLLAMQTLINVNSYSNGLDLLILDEVMDSVDALGLECIINSLDDVDRTIMIVSQNEVNALLKQTITITKKGGVSTIT